MGTKNVINQTNRDMKQQYLGFLVSPPPIGFFLAN